LLVAGFFFSVMVRRLHNPLNTAMSKPVAYATLLLIDALAVGILHQPLLEGFSPATYVAGIGLVHLLAALWLTVCVTPRREALLSWIWRFRGRRSWFADLWLGARTENAAALVTFCIIGGAAIASAAVLAVIAPAATGSAFQTAALSLAVFGVTALVILSVGTLYQWMVLVADRSGIVMCITVVATLMVAPMVAGEYYNHDLARAGSPISQFVQWFRVGTQPPVADGAIAFAGAQPLNVVPLLLAYGVLLIYAWASLRRRFARHTQVVHSRLERMNALPPERLSAGNGPAEATHRAGIQTRECAHALRGPATSGDAAPASSATTPQGPRREDR
jgi:hypothetical protein